MTSNLTTKATLAARGTSASGSDDIDPAAFHPPPMAGYERLPREILKPLCRIRDASSASAVLFDFSVIALAMAMVLEVSYWLYPLGIVMIGARQQGMLVLMHEASHRKLFRHQGLNDFVGEVLLAWPLFFSMVSYRANHFAHHRFLNTELDPDWVRYLAPDAPDRQHWRYERRKFEVWKPLILDLFGWGALGQLKRAVRLLQPRNHDPRKSPEEANEILARRFSGYPKSARVLFYLALATVLTLTGGWPAFLMLWIVPALTMLKMCIRLRLLAGHFAIYGREGVRTTLASPLERFLLGPHQIGHHAEHHLYPAVYFKNLGEVHRLMLERGDYSGEHPIRLTRGYLELIADWTRDAEAQRATLDFHQVPSVSHFH